jgi:hypothetical protein
MSYSLVRSVKPRCNPSILVYTPEQHIHDSFSTLRSCEKLIDAIFKYAFKYKVPKRLHMKGNKYMYIPSDLYDDAYKLIRVKNFDK